MHKVYKDLIHWDNFNIIGDPLLIILNIITICVIYDIRRRFKFMVKLNIHNLHSVNLQNMCDANCTYIETIELVHYEPESYNCYDKYMNQLAFICLNDGKIECRYPNDVPYSSLMFSTGIGTADNHFDNDDERCKYLELAINGINDWFDYVVRTVDMIKDGNGYKYVSKTHPLVTEQSQLRQLYTYQQSNLLPHTLLQMQKRGMSLTYSELSESILKITKRNTEKTGDNLYSDQIMTMINPILMEIYHISDNE